MKKTCLALMIVFFFSLTSPAHASEWAKKEGYFPQIWGKFVFGLKYVTLGWTTPWLESNEPEYKREWEGFCAGIGKGFVFEGVGLIHLVTFPIPVDVPDVGIGMHLPDKFCPMRHDPNWMKPAEDSKKDLTKVPEPKAPVVAVATTVAAPAPAPAPVPAPEETLDSGETPALKPLPIAEAEPAPAQKS